MLRLYRLQQVLLVLIGVAISFLGLDFALGGIHTLGWQVPPDYVTATDPSTFPTQDNHVRFLGGVFVAVGLGYLIGGLLLSTLRQSVITLSLLVACAGLFRLSAMEGALSAPVLPSLLLELLVFPALALWLWRSGADLGQATN